MKFNYLARRHFVLPPVVIDNAHPVVLYAQAELSPGPFLFVNPLRGLKIKHKLTQAAQWQFLPSAILVTNMSNANKRFFIILVIAFFVIFRIHLKKYFACVIIVACMLFLINVICIVNLFSRKGGFQFYSCVFEITLQKHKLYINKGC